MLKTLFRLVASFAILASLFLFPMAVHAVDVVDPGLCNGTTNPDFVCKVPDGGATNPIFGQHGVLTVVINIMSLAVAVIAIIVLVIAGIRYSVSQGDPGKLTNARNTIIYAVLALVIAGVAQAVVAFVLKRV